MKNIKMVAKAKLFSFHIAFMKCFLVALGDRTQGLRLAKPVLYH